MASGKSMNVHRHLEAIRGSSVGRTVPERRLDYGRRRFLSHLWRVPFSVSSYSWSRSWRHTCTVSRRTATLMAMGFNHDQSSVLWDGWLAVHWRRWPALPRALLVSIASKCRPLTARYMAAQSVACWLSKKTNKVHEKCHKSVEKRLHAFMHSCCLFS